MFPQSSPAGWGSSDWYGGGMGPPTNHSRTGAAPLSFDNAYNFHGAGGHVMTQPPVLQDFPVQLAQHHPFSLSHHDSPGPHSHGLRAGGGRGGHAGHTPHTPTTTLMYEPSYHASPVNGQGLPYHVSMTGGPADKNSLLVASSLSSRQPVSTVHHHQGNLQPGYLPRQVETSSLSCDNKQHQQNSTGYPGSLVTGPASPLVTQDQRVTSSSRLTSKDPPPLPPPPLLAGLYQGHQAAANLHSPSQPTFLACRAAAVPEMEDNKHDLTCPPISQISETKLICSTTSSSNPDCTQTLSTLTRTSAAPSDIKEDRNKLNIASFVSDEGKKALVNSTSHKQFKSRISITKLSTLEPIIEDFPRLDGNFDLEPEKEEKLNLVDNITTDPVSYPEVVEMKKASNPKKSDRDRTPKEVLRDVLEDPRMLETIPEELRAKLHLREEQLEEVSPACDCATRGLAVAENGPFYTQLGHAASLEELR